MEDLLVARLLTLAQSAGHGGRVVFVAPKIFFFIVNRRLWTVSQGRSRKNQTSKACGYLLMTADGMDGRVGR